MASRPGGGRPWATLTCAYTRASGRRAQGAQSAFAFLFTAGGAVIGPALGPGAFLLSIVGGFGTVIALQFLRERSPLNLGLLYAFATFEGMALGLILESYFARGLGDVVLNAAATT